MAEIASPASDPRSLRRHYPHQVQGVSQSRRRGTGLSAMAAPPHSQTKYSDERRVTSDEITAGKSHGMMGADSREAVGAGVVV